MIPGYVQPMPIYQTPDHGQKRDLSPLFGNTVEQVEKRIRNNSNDRSSSVSPAGELGREVNLQDVMAEFKKLATKEDLVQVKGTLVAQSAEIQQLKSELINHQERIKVLEDQAGARAAAEANRTNRKPDVYIRDRKEHGGAQASSDPSRNRRNNVIIHGIKVVKDAEMAGVVLDMCQAVGSVIFSSDIVDIARLGPYDDPTSKPPPVRVTFEYSYQRDNFLRRKHKLATLEKFAEMFVNQDEPLEMRRMRGIFRKIAYRARADGKEVVVRSEWIKIGDCTYLPTEIDKIPPEYMPDNMRRPTINLDRIQEVAGAAGVDVATQQDKVRPDVQVQTPASENPTLKKSSPNPNVKIKLTKSGLTFSGPTAFPSNLSYSDFVFKGQPYSSSEQGFQYLNAIHNEVPELATKILGTRDTKVIKELSHDIPKSESWNKIAPTTLWGLMDAKFSQNPPLMKQLIDTAPHKLIEASMDGKWGGGAPYGSDVYEQGLVPGRNVYGEMATTYRDQKITQLSINVVD